MTANLNKFESPQEGMTELEKWLGRHTKEVVILAFSHFKEMSADQHTDLTNFLKEHFKAKLCPKPQVVHILSHDLKAISFIIIHSGTSAYDTNTSNNGLITIKMFFLSSNLCEALTQGLLGKWLPGHPLL